MLQTLQWGGLGWGWGGIGGGLEEEEKKVVSGWLGFRLKTFKVANAATYKKLHFLKKMFSSVSFKIIILSATYNPKEMLV